MMLLLFKLVMFILLGIGSTMIIQEDKSIKWFGLMIFGLTLITPSMFTYSYLMLRLP